MDFTTPIITCKLSLELADQTKVVSDSAQYPPNPVGAPSPSSRVPCI